MTYLGSATFATVHGLEVSGVFRHRSWFRLLHILILVVNPAQETRSSKEGMQWVHCVIWLQVLPAVKHQLVRKCVMHKNEVLSITSIFCNRYFIIVQDTSTSYFTRFASSVTTSQPPAFAVLRCPQEHYQDLAVFVPECGLNEPGQLKYSLNHVAG